MVFRVCYRTCQLALGSPMRRSSVKTVSSIWGTREIWNTACAAFRLTSARSYPRSETDLVSTWLRFGRVDGSSSGKTSAKASRLKAATAKLRLLIQLISA
jgi:hypothetical protein